MDIKDQLAQLRRQKPFIPFRIKASDGQSIEVTEPLMFGYNEIMVLVAKKLGGAFRVRLEDIASIDMLEPSH